MTLKASYIIWMFYRLYPQISVRTKTLILYVTVEPRTSHRGNQEGTQWNIFVWRPPGTLYADVIIYGSSYLLSIYISWRRCKVRGGTGWGIEIVVGIKCFSMVVYMASGFILWRFWRVWRFWKIGRYFEGCGGGEVVKRRALGHRMTSVALQHIIIIVRA